MPWEPSVFRDEVGNLPDYLLQAIARIRVRLRVQPRWRTTTEIANLDLQLIHCDALVRSPLVPGGIRRTHSGTHVKAPRS
jgi:hypothetical protein